MYEWSEEQLMVRDAIRRFIEAEVVPNIDGSSLFTVIGTPASDRTRSG